MSQQYDADRILQLVKQGDWFTLVQLEREFLRVNCSLYRPDEIEAIVGGWLSRMIVVKWQNEEKGEGDNPLIREIEAHWGEQIPIYQRRAVRWNNPAPAEEKVREVLARMEHWKNAKK